jgi:methionyl-tRNA formyltransferase
MRIVFAGTPDFARAALNALHDAGHEIVAVLTQPDRPSGRGRSLAQSPVKELALKLGLQVLQPESLRRGKPGADEARSALIALAPDLMVVAAYGLILPKQILELPRWGCLNIHASLLPRWRGAAPIQRALAAGDQETGVALMQMEEGLDTGPVWHEEKTAIAAEDNFESLHDRLRDIGARTLVALLENFPLPGKTPVPQRADGITYAHKISREDTVIDWSQSAQRVRDQIRAFDPYPGALAKLNGEQVKLFSVSDTVSDTVSGELSGAILEVSPQGLVIACGQGAVRVGAIQRPGGKRISVKEFLNGRSLSKGDQFG